MSGKALIPIAAAGAALYFLVDSFSKKKKTTTKKKEEFAGGIIVDSGMTSNKWGWRVVEKGSGSVPGFGGAGSRLYYGYVAEPEAPADWKIVQQDGVGTAKAAKAFALEFIAQNTPEA